MVRFIGSCTEDVSSNCYTDYYSIGHILFGYISFLVSIFIWSFLGFGAILELSLVSSIMVGVFWELFENTILVDTRFKFNKKQDCLENSLSDIIFVFIGAIAGIILAYISIEQLIIGSVYFTITTYIAYDLSKKITSKLNKKEDDGQK